ncbi:alpha/beta hydrolase (plasmid) [Rhodococcoides fascians A21d2]|uniref:alpha/beta fold hydrolase n=1 Tax=Rhodococcoides fascians TaxID=1828 RepID=UPI0013EF2893|nr:alpha/beta fold hydrolase [Rhodococcus fascians]QII03668.1 alpha/beta hydrolase [Rhodococcus fascians A21d2]
MTTEGSIPTIVRVSTDKVELHVEVLGSGPPVVLIGGTASAAMSNIPFTRQLATARTVITYDRRGTYRSTDPVTKEETGEHFVQQQATDIMSILETLNIDQTGVLATCAGSAIAFEFLLQFSAHATGVVVHDPLTVAVLPDGGAQIDKLLQYKAIAKSKGGAAAMGRFLHDHQLPFPAEFAQSADREASRGGVLEELQCFVSYQIPVNSLVQHRRKIAIAAGEVGITSKLVYARTARRVADLLGIELMTFPGDHGAYFAETADFVNACIQALLATETQIGPEDDRAR